MARISAERLEPEMVLEVSVLNDHGQMLFPAGTALTERHIEMIQSWGIAEVEIESKEDDIDEQRRLARIAEEEEKIKPLFRHCDLEEPVTREVLRLCAERRVPFKQKAQEL